MTSESCAAVGQWLMQHDEHLPPAPLVSHVEQCHVCQTALLALVSGKLAMPLPQNLLCDAVAGDLPAMLELERSDGAAAAARAYPDLWWHLWTCPSCAEIYHATALLLTATDEGLLPFPLPQVDQPLLRLTRPFLTAVFAPQLAAGATWQSSAPSRQLLAEEELPDGRISLYVGAEDAHHWYLELHMHPPRSGTLLLALGEEIYSVPLLQQYTAQISALPLTFLYNRDGAELVVCVV
ncbi:MAG: hypothetical protein EI684_20555 [Candidatus Viridilinea halotolerans]|uniref:Uncharacterized protein n=1 Tax=Candidatus Viridilinea halotolerans TaxID=2491704 RepID=A0A426TS14_9CHLR|nr:MAG: hypothetical protein EI684_20555 [Candidatus Viridilinea halotolerans]